MLYKVQRQHYGDRQYWAGETRDLDEKEAQRLIQMGILAIGTDINDKSLTNAPNNKRKRTTK